ncbi:MAG TPA: DNA repair protein RecN [Candidatus Dormibacteraeota bacterium]|nr:DNA repair protein RecN [Candidatus Dormibacteraeota bacterium]
MLKELKVRDLALVAEAHVRFEPGLNLLTGETGSGKSLIIDALGLALGARAAADQVRHGAERATVEAVFGRDRGASLTLQREIGKRSGARVDGKPSAPAQLRDLGRGLVAMHGQHEHHALLDTETQTDLLDAFAGTDIRGAVASAHASWTAAAATVTELERMKSHGEREREFLRWQLDELTRAGLIPGEDADLAAERGAVRHAARLAELGHDAAERLRDEGIARAAAALRAAAELDPRLTELAARVDALEAEAADAAAEARRYTDAIDADPSRLESIETRLALLDGIKRKYGGSVESAIEERQRLQTRLDVNEDLAGAIASAERDRAARRAELEAMAALLRRAREDAAARLQEGVRRELDGLRLEGARFTLELRPRPEIGPDGAEYAEMMFSANPGEPLAPLARVASGGELARLMLAIKTVTAAADRLPTLVFDEVDAGIGGEAAIQVGLRLKALGARHQVLVVTHLAQIASFADHHLVVEKGPGPDGRNVVAVRELRTLEERAAELARMMSGGTTPKALARARELLEESSRGASARQKALQRS